MGLSERCMVIGVAEARNLGDLVQYYCTIKLINKYFPSYKIEFYLPNADQHLLYLKGLKLDNTSVISISRKPGALELISPFLLYSPKLKCLSKTLRAHSYHLLNRFDKLIHSLSLQGSTCTFVVLGGHTYQIDNQIYERLYKFGHKKVKIAFPMSIDTHALRYYGLYNLLLKNPKRF